LDIERIGDWPVAVVRRIDALPDESGFIRRRAKLNQWRESGNHLGRTKGRKYYDERRTRPPEQLRLPEDTIRDGRCAEHVRKPATWVARLDINRSPKTRALSFQYVIE
jgi:hypothetical protein